MSIFSRTSFGAVISPSGIHLAEFRRTVQDARIVRYLQAEAVPGDAAASARMLAVLLDSIGARGRGISLAVSGFGSCHELISLPAAPEDELRPLIAREMRRLYPDLFTSHGEQPILEYVEIAAGSADPGSAGRDFLVGAAPAALVRMVTDTLAEYGVPVTGWTITPRALQRLHQAFGDSVRSEALVLVLPGAPLLGLFHQGRLRLLSHPVGAPAAADAALTVGELVEHAADFLRRQHRGASLERALIAADSEAADEICGALRTKQGLRAEPFGLEAPGALLALGAALDADHADRLSLLPPGKRPLFRGEVLARALGVASAAILIAASAWWSWDAHAAERQTLRQLQGLQSELARQEAATAEIREAVRERRSHAQRALLLEMLARNHRGLPESLWPFEAAAQAVEVVRMQVRPGELGWRIDVTATARGRSSFEATDAVDALVSQLEAQLAGEKVLLSQMSYAPPVDQRPPEATAPETQLTFEISFTVPFNGG